MKTVKGTWALPTKRESGQPLKAEDILHARVDLSSDGGTTWAEHDLIPGSQPQETVASLGFGTYIFRITIVDVDGREAGHIEETVSVVDDSPPLSANSPFFTVE